jgi:chromosome segregation ATPase
MSDAVALIVASIMLPCAIAVVQLVLWRFARLDDALDESHREMREMRARLERMRVEVERLRPDVDRNRDNIQELWRERDHLRDIMTGCETRE